MIIPSSKFSYGNIKVAMNSTQDSSKSFLGETAYTEIDENNTPSNTSDDTDIFMKSHEEVQSYSI